MGTLGLSLFFVGITLTINGICRITQIDSKSTSFMNVVTGVIIIYINFVGITHATGIANYQNITSGLLFGITYIFIGANYLLKLDLRPFAWFSLFATFYAIILAYFNFNLLDFRLSILWLLWSIIWLSAFVDIVLKVNIFKAIPYILIFEGLFAAFIPSMLMLLNIW